MTSPVLDSLLARIVESGLLVNPTAENGLVYGRASIDAAGSVGNVNVDAELDERGEDVEHEALVAAVSRILSIGESKWRAVIEEIATDINDAIDDEPVVSQLDLRDDLEATSVVVFSDALLLAFLAPKQFPDSRILVQLDEELEIEGVEVRELDEELEIEGVEVRELDGTATVEFDNLDDLLDEISRAED